MAELKIYSRRNYDVVYRQSSSYPYDPNEYPIVWGAASANYATDSFLPIGQGEVDYAGAPADPPRFIVWRGFFWFTTSSIPADAEINSIKLYIKRSMATVYYDNDYSLIVQRGIDVDEDNIPIVHHNPYDYTDYNKANVSGNGGSIPAVDIGAVGEYFCITLNATGIGWVNKGPGAISKLCVRTNKEIDGIEPEWRENKYITVYMSDDGVSYSDRPYLLIDYTILAIPTVTTQAVTNITHNSATGNGTITDTGAYAINEIDTGYGVTVQLITTGPPTVTTQAVTDIEIRTATANGTIVSGVEIFERGFEYGLTETPTKSVLEEGVDLGLGPYSLPLTKL